MKAYQKAEMIAKNLPTGSYAAGCPAKEYSGNGVTTQGGGWYSCPAGCRYCELAG